jgi:hypothetical protein
MLVQTYRCIMEIKSYDSMCYTIGAKIPVNTVVGSCVADVACVIIFFKAVHNTPMEGRGERRYCSYSLTTSALDGGE